MAPRYWVHKSVYMLKEYNSIFVNILGVKKSTYTAAAVYAVRKVPFVLHRKFALIKYLRKLLKSNDCILIYCYVKKFDGVENHKKNSTWCLMLKNWLIYLGFNEIWHAQMQ